MHPAPQTLHDTMDPARAAALWATLALPGAAPGQGAPLPPFFHQLYFWSPEPPGQLGRDGHPVRGGLVPEMGLPRRMWAGGRLRFHAPLVAGIPAIKVTTLEQARRKSGRSGPLGFVTLRHDLHQNGTLCVTEHQDLVYRPEAAPPAAPPAAPDDAAVQRAVTFDSTTLFRYSALTFNGHRIHYDIDYARDVEGYAGLVVHGPLLAQHLMLMATDLLGPLAAFDFRLTAPLICGEPAVLCANGGRLWVRGPDGRQCGVANATAR
ncbi:MAG: acyl dehydratase [Rhodobacterales bacterium]|nr:acyl dehydratase [Rhodobacterales bacterium]